VSSNTTRPDNIPDHQSNDFAGYQLKPNTTLRDSVLDHQSDPCAGRHRSENALSTLRRAGFRNRASALTPSTNTGRRGSELRRAVEGRCAGSMYQRHNVWCVGGGGGPVECLDRRRDTDHADNALWFHHWCCGWCERK
jgi:hypothetical protein